MYQDHFGLHDDPFALGPNLRFLFRSRAHAETMAHLGYGLEQGEDIVLISGAIGTGKTLALHNLQAKISKLFRQVVINVTQLTFREFLKMVLDELDETWPDQADTADLLVRLKARTTALRRDGRKILLVVDEAQNLEPETLEGIRLLTNIGQPDQQVFQIVLSGQPGLEAVVNRPELAQLRQRIRIHYRLEPLSAEETGEYIAHRLTVAGQSEQLFTPNAIKKIHALSGGIPRLVNHLAGHALLVAFVDKSRNVDAKHVAADEMPETPAVSEDRTGAVPVKAVPAEPTPVVADQEPEPPLAPPPPRDPEPVFEPEPEPEPAPDPEPAPVPVPAQSPEPDADVLALLDRSDRRPALTPARPVAPAAKPPRNRTWIWAAVVVLAAAGAWALLRGDLLGGGQARTQPTPPRSLPPVETTGDQFADASTTDPTMGDPAEPVAQTVAASGSHWLHVASFRDQARADRYGAILTAAGVVSQVQPVALQDGEVWQRVLVGPFAGETAAAETAASLEDQGLISFHRILQR